MDFHLSDFDRDTAKVSDSSLLLPLRSYQLECHIKNNIQVAGEMAEWGKRLPEKQEEMALTWA